MLLVHRRLHHVVMTIKRYEDLAKFKSFANVEFDTLCVLFHGERNISHTMESKPLKVRQHR